MKVLTSIVVLLFGVSAFGQSVNNTNTVRNLLVLTNALVNGGARVTGAFTNSALTASRFATIAADKSLASTGTSAALLGTLSDETGTGLAVFNDSPDFATDIQITSAANTIPLTIGGYSLTGSDASPAAKITGTWNTSGNATGLLLNITNTASGASSLLMDLQADGVSKFSVKKNGDISVQQAINFGANTGYISPQSGYGVIIQLTSVAALNLYDGALSLGTSADTIVRRDAANVLQLGSDSATPSAQTIKAADGSGTDKNGANLTIEGGQSTGTGGGGDFDIATSLTAEATGSNANAYSLRYHANAKFVALTHNTATTIETFSLAANKILGGELVVTTYATNATPHLQARTTSLVFQAVAVSTTITGTIDVAKAGTLAASSGTMTETYTLLDNGNNTFSIQLAANSDLSTPTERCKVVVTALNGNAAITITDP